MRPIRVLIADDHALIRSGIKFILAEADDIVVVGEATNGADIVKLTDSVPWDVAILDINMPIRNGIEALKIIRERWPKNPILILSAYSEDQYAVRAIEAGASGYISKQSTHEELVHAIRHVNSGKRFITPAVAELLACAVGKRDRGSVDALSNRELQLLMILSSGKTLVEAAKLLNLSPHTLSVYRRRILDKLGLKNTNDLVRYGVENGLVD